MKRIILFFTCLSLLVSCSVRLEKRVYNKGYYVHIPGKNNSASDNAARLSIFDTASGKNSLQIKSSQLPENAPVSLSLLKEKDEDYSTSASKTVSGFFSEINFSVADDDSAKVLIVHPLVGEIIDSTEKAKYQLFDFWANSNFASARFLEKEGRIYLEGIMKSGEVITVPYTELDFNKVTTKIASPVKENPLDDDVVTGFLIALYVLLFLILIFILAILSIIVLALGGAFLGSLAIMGSLSLLGIVLRAMVSSIEDRP